MSKSWVRGSAEKGCWESDEGRSVSPMGDVRRMWDWGPSCEWAESILRHRGLGESAGRKGSGRKARVGGCEVGC